MQKTMFEKILDQIAAASQVSSAELRCKMQSAMDCALNDPSPSVQAMWDSIPRKGEEPTLEEFMEYLVAQNLLLP